MVQWVLSSKEINFPYPVALTLLHMLFSSVVCFILTKVFKVCSLLNNVHLYLGKKHFLEYAIMILIDHLIILTTYSSVRNLENIIFFPYQVIKIEGGMTLDMWGLYAPIYLFFLACISHLFQNFLILLIWFISIE